ncbi:MAG: PH domain-containing protein [Jatrophihabitantaceae bacterium]
MTDVAEVPDAATPVVPDSGWRRLSPRMLLVHPVIEVGKALPAIAGAFLAGHSSGDGSSGSRWSLAIAAAVAALSLLRWFTTRFRITPEQVQMRRGLVRRRTMAAPIDRVRTVDVTSHLLHRALGLARVAIGTGTSDRKGRNALVLDGLTAGAAAALRSELLHRGTGRPLTEPGVPAVTVQPVEDEIARLDRSWLRYAPFTLTGAVTGLALLGVLWRVVSEGHVDLRRLKPYRDAADHLERWPLAVDILLVLAVVAAFVALASTVGYLLSFWNFRLTRHSGGTLHVTRGLLTSRATSIEHRRLRGAELSEPMLLRSVGGARALVIATGLRVGRGAERGGEILLPPAPRREAVRVASTVIETAMPFVVPLLPHPPAARRRRIARALLTLALAGALLDAVALLAGWPLWLLLFSVALVLAAAPLGNDRYRSLGHTFVDGYVVSALGSLVRRRCAVVADGVIGWNLRSSYFQRRLGLTTLTATTAAGKQHYAVEDVAPAEAIRFADTTVPGLLTEFLA